MDRNRIKKVNLVSHPWTFQDAKLEGGREGCERVLIGLQRRHRFLPSHALSTLELLLFLAS